MTSDKSPISLLGTGLHVTQDARAGTLASLVDIIGHLTEGLVVADPDGALLAMNPQALRMHGYQSLDEAAHHLEAYTQRFSLFSLEGEELSVEAWPLPRVLRGERVSDVEVEVRCLETGKAFFAVYNGGPVYKDGRMVLAVLTLQDVTERRMASQTAEERERWFRSLFEAVEDEVFVYRLTPEGTAGPLIEANPEACRRLGYTRDELLGMYVSDVVDASTVNVADALAVLERDRRLIMESVHVTKDGRRIPVEVSAVLFEHDGHPSVLSVCRDITERKRADTALRESEARYRTLSDSMPQIVWMLRPDGSVQYFNARWTEYTGLPAHTDSWMEVIHPDDRAAVPSLYDEALARGEGYEVELRMRRADGAYRWHLARVVPMRKDSEIFSWLGTATDIDERRNAEEALRGLNETLEERVRARTEALLHSTRELARSNHVLQQRNRELQDFTYVASHDLQEPLRKVRTFADLLHADYAHSVDEQGQLYLERMQDAAGRMSRLINELLAFSRVMTKGLPFEAVDLNEVLGDVIRSLKPRLEEAGARIEVEQLPTVEADPLQMEMLLQNLLHNAVKFRPPDTAPQVHVRARVEELRVDGMPAARPVCVLEVADNGIGFEERYLDKIFSPFQRLHARSTYAGTGMGLALCRRIVERHGGEITARSKTGQGSTFVVMLPLRQRYAAPEAHMPAEG